ELRDGADGDGRACALAGEALDACGEWPSPPLRLGDAQRWLAGADEREDGVPADARAVRRGDEEVHRERWGADRRWVLRDYAGAHCKAGGGGRGEWGEEGHHAEHGGARERRAEGHNESVRAGGVQAGQLVPDRGRADERLG